MAKCGICNAEVSEETARKIDRCLSGVSFPRLLEEHFDFYPRYPYICVPCGRSLEQIVKVIVKLEKLTISRNELIDNFKERLAYWPNTSTSSSASGCNTSPQSTEFTSEQGKSTAATSEKAQLQDRTGRLDSEVEDFSVFPDLREESQDDGENGSSQMDLNTGFPATEAETHSVMQQMTDGGRHYYPPSDALGEREACENSQNRDQLQNPSPRVTSTKPVCTETRNNTQARQKKSKCQIAALSGRDSDSSHSNDLDKGFVREHGDGEDECSLSDLQENRGGDGNISSESRLSDLYTCGLCSRTFSVAQLLSKHMYTHKENPKWVRCGKCEKTFKTSSRLVAHVKNAHTAFNRLCEVCSESLADPLMFRAHMKAHRDRKEKVYRCRQCPKTFQSPLDLQKHKKVVHYQQRVYLCQWCSKIFTNSSSFNYHCKIHTGEKPFQCQFCPAAFKESNKLKNHMNKHSGVKPFKCDQCSQSFPYPSGLATHLKIHKGEKPYKCELCSKDFLLALGLKNHMRSAHSDARPYVCQVCSAAFKLKAHLKRHLILHSGNRPFQCKECAASFTQKGNLKIHMKVHNRAEESMELCLWTSEGEADRLCSGSELGEADMCSGSELREADRLCSGSELEADRLCSGSELEADRLCSGSEVEADRLCSGSEVGDAVRLCLGSELEVVTGVRC